MNPIRSIDDLHDTRARRIAKKYGIDAREILPGYLELMGELIASGGQIAIDTANPETPLNVHATYMRKLACGVVLSYELSRRDEIQLPVSETPAVISASGNTFLAGLSLKGLVTRATSAEAYDALGQQYERLIELLDNYQKQFFDSLS